MAYNFEDKTPIRVWVIRNSDGAEVEYICSWREDKSWYRSDLCWFKEGNMSCDCNRHLVFERFFGREPSDEELTCGSGRYSLRIEGDPEDEEENW